MLNGFRWQLLALVISILVFATVLSFRLFGVSSEVTPTATLETTQAPTMTVAPTFTPLPTQVIDTSNIVPEDTVMTFTEGIVGNVQRLNPLFVTSQAERDITSLIFEGLMTINEFGARPAAVAVTVWSPAGTLRYRLASP